MRRLLAVLSPVLLFAACSGGSDSGGPVTPPPTPTISVALASSAGTVARGATGTTTVTLTRGGNYTGAVTLAAANLPSGVTATFAPATLSGTTTSATATFTVGATAAPGTATVTISAAGSGVATASATYALTVPTPAIALAAGSTALTVTQGGTATVPVTITRSNGFADAVTLAVSGLPTGVTGTFNPASIAAGATTSTLSLAVGAGAAAGTSSFTITASGTGVTAQTATVNLTVTASATPAFSLTATPAAATVTAGQSATASIGIARTGGFAGEVTLALEGAPAGMTGTFGTNPVGGTVFASILTLSTTAAVAPGTYNLTVRGTGTSVTAQTTAISVTVAAPPGITLATSPATLSLAAGGTTTATVTITRLGGFAGDVALAATGLPTGVTAAFAPATLTGTTLTSTLTLTAAANATLGAATVSITASGTGITAQSSSVALSVAAAQGYSLAATSTTLAQGGTGTSTVTITRTGGFAGTVNLTVSGLPNGVTASVNPAAVTGTSATITFSAAAGASTGAFTATVTGTAPGLANVTTTVAGTVTPSGGTSGNITWQFCDLEDLPLYFAFRAGTSGAWTRVLPAANNIYSFTLNGPGSVVIVRPMESGVSNVVQYNFTAAEMAGTASFECTQNPVSKTLTGTVAGLTGTQTAQVSVGGSTATATLPTSAYTVTDVSTGLTDLIAYRVNTALTGGFVPTTTPDRMILRRNVNYPAGSAIPLLDFGGSEAFAPASATYTLAGAGAGEISQLLAFFNTANGSSGGFFFGSALNTSGSATVYGVPTSRLATGDFHFAIGLSVALDGSSQRGLYQYNRELVNRTLTLGPQLSTPSVTSLGTTPYARLRSTGSWQAEYGDGVGVTFSQGTTASNVRTWTVSQSRGFAAGSTYQLEIPDLSGTSGWNNTWGLAGGLQTTVSTSATGGAVQAFITPAEGAAFRQASRTTQITP